MPFLQASRCGNWSSHRNNDISFRNTHGRNYRQDEDRLALVYMKYMPNAEKEVLVPQAFFLFFRSTAKSPFLLFFFDSPTPRVAKRGPALLPRHAAAHAPPLLSLTVAHPRDRSASSVSSNNDQRLLLRRRRNS